MKSQSDEDLQRRVVAGHFALEVMHEIRNPLEALGHLTYLARENAHDEDLVRTYMSMADEQMQTLNGIVSHTLGFAKASFVAQPVDLVFLAEAALRIHRRTIDERRIHLVKDLGETLVAEMHSGQILQVVSNLIVNALDALPEEGTLTVRLRKRNGGVHILIADNGHGISRDDSSAIFEPFFSTKGERGTGLGLSLSKKIIERHKGKMIMRSSVCPSRCGTMFRVSLPA